MSAEQISETGFDRKARELHAAAIANVSAATVAQLQQRRRQVSAGERRPTPGILKPLAWTGAFALLAVAVVVPMAHRLPATTPPLASVPAPVKAFGGDDTVVATLEEDPGLYLWLASSDAITLASE